MCAKIVLWTVAAGRTLRAARRTAIPFLAVRRLEFFVPIVTNVGVDAVCLWVVILIIHVTARTDLSLSGALGYYNPYNGQNTYWQCGAGSYSTGGGCCESLQSYY
jgi:hypothetical protein